MYDNIHNVNVSPDMAYKYAYRNDKKEDIDSLCYSLYLYHEKVKERDRKEFINLLLDDENIKNNRELQEKYIELYDKYTGK